MLFKSNIIYYIDIISEKEVCWTRQNLRDKYEPKKKVKLRMETKIKGIANDQLLKNILIHL